MVADQQPVHLGKSFADDDFIIPVAAGQPSGGQVQAIEPALAAQVRQREDKTTNGLVQFLQL